MLIERSSSPPSTKRIDPGPSVEGISRCARFFARASPVIRFDSSRVGPLRVMTLTLVGSATIFPFEPIAMVSAALTAHCAMTDCICVCNFPANDVFVAARICSFEASILNSGIASLQNCSAIRYPRAMVAGWTPCTTKCQAFCSHSAARRTVVVVPSRTV